MAFKYVNFPGFVKLNKYVDPLLLEEIQRFAWILTSPRENSAGEVVLPDDVFELRKVYLEKVPVAQRVERLEAIKELGLIAQAANHGV